MPRGVPRRSGGAGNILVAWVMTIPCAALVGAGMEVVTRLPGGAAIVFVLTGAIATLAFTGRGLQNRWERRGVAMVSATRP